MRGIYCSSTAQKKDNKDRRKGKGHHFCLGGIIYSIPSQFCTTVDDLNFRMHQDDLNEKDYFILFFEIVLGKTASSARQLINSFPQTEATTFAFSSVFILLLHMLYSQECNRFKSQLIKYKVRCLFLQCVKSPQSEKYIKVNF